MVIINVKFPIRADKIDEWDALARQYAADCNAEDGCVFFEVSRGVDDPNTYYVVEGFRDGDAGGAHVGTDHFKHFVATAPDLVSAQPQIIYVDNEGTTGWGPMGEISPR